MARKIPAMRQTAADKARAEKMRKELRVSVGANLVRLRAEANLTQRQLSELSDISQTYISQAESAKRNLSIDMIALLAAALRKRPRDLITD